VATHRLALSDENGIQVHGLAGQRLIQSIPVPDVADMHCLSPQRLLVATEGGAWATIDLEIESLLDAAGAAQTGSFSVDECSRYRIEPCPAAG